MLSPLLQTLSGGKCISHSYFNKPQQLPSKDGKIIFSLLIEPDVDKVSTMKTEDDEEKKIGCICLLLDESEFFNLK